MAFFLIFRRAGDALAVGEVDVVEVDVVEAEVVEAGMEGAGTVGAPPVVHNMAHDLQAVIEAVRDQSLAGEILPGRHHRALGVAVIVDMADVVGIRWMTSQRRWRP